MERERHLSTSIRRLGPASPLDTKLQRRQASPAPALSQQRMSGANYVGVSPLSRKKTPLGPRGMDATFAEPIPDDVVKGISIDDSGAIVLRECAVYLHPCRRYAVAV